MGRAPNFCRMLLVASTALASTIGASCGGDSSPVSADSADLEAALPDLDDVPNGYQVGDKSGCGALGLEGATPVIEGLLEGTFPEGVAVCRRDLTWAWREAGSNPAGLSVYLFSWPDDEIAARPPPDPEPGRP